MYQESKGSWLAGAEPAGCLSVCGHTLCCNWLDICVDVSSSLGHNLRM